MYAAFLEFSFMTQRDVAIAPEVPSCVHRAFSTP